MNQFYLYDKVEAGAYNRARLKPDLRLSRGVVIGAGGDFFVFLIADDHSEVPTFVSSLL
jgi:hypothetical protein